MLIKYLVCFENHARHINTHCGQNTEIFLNVEAAVHIISTVCEWFLLNG